MTHRVLLINDDAFELTTLAEAMRLRGVNVVGEAHTIGAAQNLFRTLRPEVVVIDAHFNSYGGIILARALRKEAEKLGIVLTTACPDLRLLGLIEKDIPAGSQLVLKRTLADLNILCLAVPASVKAIAGNEKMQWVNRFTSPNEKSFLAIAAMLTDIQAETLRLVASGMSNGEIGRQRYVSEKSVEQIVARIASLLGIAPDRSHNLRVLMTNEYNKWIGSPRH
ncbi:MAG: response regulator transcription factor [Actinobacteria bacterium]|nr:response regulator transcription factor [Actinomycetota bacterium]